MAAQGDIEGIIKTARWVADNEEKNELLANYLRDIIEKNIKIDSSQLENIYEIIKKTSKTDDNNQLVKDKLKKIISSETNKINKQNNLFPNTVESHLSYAKYYTSINKPEFAEEHYLKAIELSEGALEPYIEYTQYLEETNRIEDAMIQYHKALKNNSSNSIIHNNLGMLYYQEGQLEEATKQLKKSLKLEYDLQQ